MQLLKARKTRLVLAARRAGKSAAETVAVMMARLPVARPTPARVRHPQQRHRLRPARPARERLLLWNRKAEQLAAAVKA